MLKQASTYLIAHGSSALLGLLSVVLFTRLLSPAEYGIYIVGMGVAGIVSALLFTWVRLSILRFESEGGSVDVRRTALHAYRLSLLATPLAVVVAVVATGQPWVQAVLAVSLAVALGIFEFSQEVLRARQNSTAYLQAAVSRAVIALCLSLALISAGFGGLGLMAGLAGGYALTALLFAPSVWCRPLQPFNRAIFRQMARFGVPMALSGVVFAASAALDRLIVSTLLGASAAGVYGASADLVRQIILFPAMAIGSVVFPIAIRSLAENGRDAVDAHLMKSTELLLAVVLPAVVGLALVAPQAAALILGQEFQQSATRLMPILSFAWLFQTVSTQFAHVSFHLAKRPRLMVFQGCGNLLVNVAAMVVLVPRFQLVGAAWALLIAEAAGLAIGYALSRWAHPLPLPYRAAGRVILAVAAMALPAGLVAGHDRGGALVTLVLAAATGVLVYVIAALGLDLAGSRTALMTNWIEPAIAGRREHKARPEQAPRGACELAGALPDGSPERIGEKYS
jgi:O-antigen/teichoic acid export membrane protein